MTGIVTEFRAGAARLDVVEEKGGGIFVRDGEADVGECLCVVGFVTFVGERGAAFFDLVAERHPEGVAEMVVFFWRASEGVEEWADVGFGFGKLAESIGGGALDGGVLILQGAQRGGLADGGEVFVFGEDAHGVNADVAIGMTHELANGFLIEGR